MHDSNTEPAVLAQSLKSKPAETGDIVWIHGDYAEVLGVTMSKYGYPAYHVKYIERSPLDDVPDDWFAGFEVRLVARKEKVEEAADAAGDEIQKSTGKREDRSELLNCAKRAVARLSAYQLHLRQNSSNLPTTNSASPASPIPREVPKDFK